MSFGTQRFRAGTRRVRAGAGRFLLRAGRTVVRGLIAQGAFFGPAAPLQLMLAVGARPGDPAGPFAAAPAGPPPGHPERLCGHLPPSAVERELFGRLWPADAGGRGAGWRRPAP